MTRTLPPTRSGGTDRREPGMPEEIRWKGYPSRIEMMGEEEFQSGVKEIPHSEFTSPREGIRSLTRSERSDIVRNMSELTTDASLRKMWRAFKNQTPALTAVLHWGYPRFVFDGWIRTLKGQVPVFTFHSVEPEPFESRLRYLHRNGYRTLTADELLAVLNREAPVPDRSVVLSFDDGWGSLKTVAYPLLKQYGFKAVAFIAPALIGDETAGSVKSDRRRFCTWAELREMQLSGVVDIQSHSLNHPRVFISPKIVDFHRPKRSGNHPKLNFPVYRESGQDRWDRQGRIGMPIYESQSIFSGRHRYFDDEKLREMCVQFVAERGESEFFSKKGSTQTLLKIVQDYRNSNIDLGRFADSAETDRAMIEELQGSKRRIEEKLPGHRVRHFCYPWWNGCERAVQLSKETGYEANFWGRLVRRPANRPGDDPFHIVRLRDYYIFRLPGEGRKSLRSVASERSEM
ncbi:MAG TPA: polysaccharide deacetylase family protein [Nitrospiria bacterium]|nr:polysaccharide deacetylase family protein [Nitrospiria bacterium]